MPDRTPTPESHPTLQSEEAKAPVLPETKEEAYFINSTDKTAQLPETGSENSNLAFVSLSSLLAGMGLYARKRRKC
ncbi:Gram positive anchor [Streptococcus vestibularis]|uniref:Gram positive anchor n=2 Tax=Streptococcus vestibularis TaxID=1343 RepID=A0A564S7V7_STRVE|nr:Gram positive anchor [Streptococcus vestibularis]